MTCIFALVALGLAAIGIYAVVAYSVARRTREFGVRLALGATRRSVVLLALAEALRPVFVGSVLGVGLAVASSRFIQTFLFDVSAVDPVALAGGRADTGPRGHVRGVAAGPPGQPAGSSRGAAARLENGCPGDS